jgi:hypothetical protein
VKKVCSLPGLAAIGIVKLMGSGRFFRPRSACADTFAARLRFGRSIGMVSAEENSYFFRAFEAFGITETRRAADPDT